MFRRLSAGLIAWQVLLTQSVYTKYNEIRPQLDAVDPETVIAVKFKFSFGERLKASLVLMLRSPVTLISASIFPLAGSALLVASLLCESRVSPLDSALIAACFAFTPLAILFNIYRAQRAQRDLPFHSYEFSRSGLHMATETTDIKQTWKAISRIDERSGFLFLFLGKRRAHCIPIRAFSNAAEVQTVKEFASSGRVAGI